MGLRVEMLGSRQNSAKVITRVESFIGTIGNGDTKSVAWLATALTPEQSS